MATNGPEVVTLPLGQLQTNCYLVICPETRSALAIDPADQAGRVLAAGRALGARIEQILLTHAHLDHIMGLPDLIEETSAKLIVHRREIEMLGQYARLFGLRREQLPKLEPDVTLAGGEDLTVGSMRGAIIHTPGHSPGAVSLHIGDTVFTGDTLFAQGVGRVDLPGGDHQVLLASIEKLFLLPDETVVYPGHGPSSTIGAEKRTNPYVDRR
jgi:hydroxyacylglutathione hydrolase